MMGEQGEIHKGADHVRTKEWIYHTPWLRPKGAQMRPRELYDRQSDPEELVNVIEQHPQVARELQAHLDELLSKFDTSAHVLPQSHRPAAAPGVDWEAGKRRRL